MAIIKVLGTGFEEKKGTKADIKSLGVQYASTTWAPEV